MIDPVLVTIKTLLAAPTNRRVLGGLVGGSVAGLVGWRQSAADAKRQHQTHRQHGHRRRHGGHKSGVDREGHAAGKSAGLKVLTHNIYLGADLTVLATVSTPQQLIAAMTQLFAGVQATNFPERATALAAEIAAVQPHVVGLQEVTLWRRQSPSDFPSLPNATEVVYDYLALVLDALAARGQSYQAVAVVQNTDVEAPRRISGELEDIRMTDRNVVLARTDLPATVFAVGQVQTGHFAAQAPNPVPQVGSLRQGWAAVEVSLHGRALRVVNTHLTPVQDTIQEAQGGELLAGPLATSLPTILLADLNSAANGTGAIPGHTLTATYANLLAAGFADAAVTKPGHGPVKNPGFTCCQDADLRNASSHLSQRLDYVLLRNGLSASSANRVGADPADRTPSGLWPSDHAGVWAVLHLQDA